MATSKTMTIHSRSENKWRGTNTACGWKVPDEATTEDALAITCGASACQNERNRVLRALDDATSEERIYPQPHRWSEPSEPHGRLSYPLNSAAAVVEVDGLGLTLTIHDEAEAANIVHLAAVLHDACGDALRIIRARFAYPDAVEQLASLDSAD